MDLLVLSNGIAQWLECWTCDWKVMDLNPCRSGGRIFFSRVKFLCWLLFWYLFHSCITAVAHKRSWSSCQSAGGRLQINTHTPYVCGFAWNDIVHGCMVYTERAETAVSCGITHASAVITPLRWTLKIIFKKLQKKLVRDQSLSNCVLTYFNTVIILLHGRLHIYWSGSGALDQRSVCLQLCADLTSTQ